MSVLNHECIYTDHLWRKEPWVEVMESLSVDSQLADEQLSTKVVERVAAFKGTESVELDPLYEVINPDALNRLFTNPSGTERSGQISFVYCGCEVIVEDDGQVLVQGPPENSTTDRKKQRTH